MSSDLLLKIKAVNQVLKKGEPGNVSVDNFSKPPQSGYKPQYVIDAMNAELWGLWGFEEISNELVDKDKDSKPKLAIARVEVWMDGVKFRPSAYGQARCTQGNYGDARKGAQTDAIKKALSYFSVGNRAYHGKLK